jgi:hypothetical protein
MRRVPAEWRKVQALRFGVDGLTAKKPGEAFSHTEQLEKVENRISEKTPPMAGRPLPPPDAQQRTTPPMEGRPLPPPSDQRLTPRLESLPPKTSTLPLAGR